MTSRVHVDAHAGWPIEVTLVNLDDSGAETGVSITVVAPYTAQDFHVWDDRAIRIREMRRETESPS